MNVLLSVDVNNLFGQPVKLIVRILIGNAVAAPGLNKAGEHIVGIFVGEAGGMVNAARGLALVIVDIFLNYGAVELFGRDAVVIVVEIFDIVAAAVGGFGQQAVLKGVLVGG